MNREHEILLGINVNDRKRRDELIDKNGATLLDTYDAQLEEYMEICSLSDKDISSPKEVFIYYPWRNSIVRLLEQEAFERVRTNRNRNKITFEETKILQQKRVGVIGLSVGRSVSITMAQESIVGELRLADFDTLDLSNLNRIKAPLVDLGIKKTVSVQREIAELSPFLSVKTFDEGITLKNIEEFVGQGDNQLDLIIDECDSIEIKVLCRQVA